MEFYEQFFQVTQEEVVGRVILSFIPPRREFIESIKGKADFYGPFWILTTIIFLVSSTGNLSSYFKNWDSEDFIFNLTLIRYAVLIIYPVGFVFPTLLYFLVRFLGCTRIELQEVFLS